MKIIDILNKKDYMLSFEVFPPKTDSNYENVAQAVKKIGALHPDYMSITYGAGGGTSRHTISMAAELKEQYGVSTMTHLTCVSSNREQIKSQLDRLRSAGIENVLALRGDIPPGMTAPFTGDYPYASELIREIRSYGGFCIGGACYPEGHIESLDLKSDIAHLKEKADAGCDFLTTQMFFDNHILYNFLYKIREAGITIPIVAGIMPVTNKKQIKRICQLSGTQLPQRFRMILDRFGDQPAAMKQAGIAYATEQIIDLMANGINAVHVYSMNHPDVAQKIQENLSEIVPSIREGGRYADVCA